MSEQIVIGKIAFGPPLSPNVGATQVVNGISDWKVEQATCQKCRERPATETWSEGTIAYVHGLYQRWCKPCVLTAQIAHARAMVAQIPALEAELAELLRAAPEAIR